MLRCAVLCSTGHAAMWTSPSDMGGAVQGGVPLAALDKAVRASGACRQLGVMGWVVVHSACDHQVQLGSCDSACSRCREHWEVPL